MNRLTKFFVLLVLVASLVGLGAMTTVKGQATPYHIFVVTHGQASDSFWSVVKKGVDDAAKAMNVTADYEAPTKTDVVAMGQMIDAAVAAKADGLVVSVPDVTALGPSIKKAVAAGIPVIGINSGWPDDLQLGLLAHIGQTEYDAGLGGGQRMAAAGAKNALCVVHEQGNSGLEQRCKGFTDAMTKAGGKVTLLAVDGNDPTNAAGQISAKLTADASIDAIMALGPLGANPTLKALTDAKLLGKVKLATFDLGKDVLQAIQDGNILFAIDQQQYTQGYLAIVYMTLYLRNLNTPGNQLIPTGPGFVTKDNAAQIAKYYAAGTR
jgi:simple sugar transport system substrate-binding protein